MSIKRSESHLIICESCGKQGDAPKDSEFFCYVCLQASDCLADEPKEWEYEYFNSEAEARFGWAMYCLIMHGETRPFPGDGKITPETGKGAVAI